MELRHKKEASQWTSEELIPIFYPHLEKPFHILNGDSNNRTDLLRNLFRQEIKAAINSAEWKMAHARTNFGYFGTEAPMPPPPPNTHFGKIH